MMKQASSIVALPSFDPNVGTEIHITKEERKEVLKNQSSKTGILLMDKKKKLLIRVVNLQEDIIKKSSLFDVVYSSNLEDQFKSLTSISINRINKAKNDDLLQMIVDLLDPFSMLFKHLFEQNDVSGKLRRSENSRDSVMTLASDVNDLKTKIDNRIIHEIQNSTNPLAKWMFKLTDKQKERQFDKDRIPSDPSH